MTTKQELAAPKKDHPWRKLIYMTTACSAASFAGLIGAYAMIKKAMSEQLGIQEGFLGLLDGMSFLGTTIGYLFLLFKPIKYPKRDFIINCIITLISLSIIPLTPNFITISQPILIISQLISGFCRAYMMVPYMIVIQYFDAAIQNRIAINFWCSFAVLGDVTAVIAVSFMLNNLNMNWKICFYISLVAFLFFVLLQHFTADQVDMDQHHKHSGQPGQNTWRQTKQFLVNFFGKGQNFFWMIDYAFVSSLYFSILMWFPYYFLHLGYQYETSVISIMYPVFTCIRVLVYEYPILLCPSKAHWVIFAMLGTNVSFYIIMAQFGQDRSYILPYIILVALSGLVKGGPYPTITSSEMRLRAKTNRDVYFAMTVCKIALMFLTVFLMVVIGVLMQMNLKSFLYVLSVSTAINFLVNVFRNLYYGPAGKSKQTLLQTENKNEYAELNQQIEKNTKLQQHNE